MSQEVGSLHYDLDITDAKLNKALDSADAKVKKLGDSLSNEWQKSVEVSKKLLAGIVAVGAGVVAFGASSVKAYQEAQDVMAQTNAVIKSTGGVAGVTAEKVSFLASMFQNMTKFSDETVQSGMNLLLTFTNIGKDIFPQATRTMLDMSQALGQDVKASAVQLGKALQDPIMGVTALRRVGVNFTEAQQDVIKKLVETGKSAEAQKLILKELKTEFGNSAISAGETFSGKLEILKNSFGDLQEEVGRTIMIALIPLMDKFSNLVFKISEAGGLLEYLKQKFEQNRRTIYVIAGGIAGALVPALVSLAISIGSVVLSIAPFIVAGMALAYLWQENKLLFWALTGIIAGFAVGITVALMPAIIGATGGFLALAVAVISATWPFIAIGAVVGTVAYLIVKHWGAIKNGASDAFNAVISWFKTLPSKILDAVGKMVLGNLLYNTGKTIIQGLLNGIKDKFNDVKNTLGGFTNKIKEWKGPAPVDKVLLVDNAKLIMGGFITGLESEYSKVKDSLGGFTSSLASPQISGGNTSNTSVVNGGNMTINIGNINDKQDADYILDRVDRNFRLQSRGGSAL